MNYKFITFEGGEGTGKSSLIRRLSEELSKMEIPHIKTFEPGGTPLANVIREVFKHPKVDLKKEPIEPLTELFLLSAARVQHVQQKILPALKEGKIVLCDRFYDSTRVYQGILSGNTIIELEDIIKMSVNDLEPSITFLIDCPAEISCSRIKNRGQLDSDRFDEGDIKYHEKIRQGYLKVASRFPNRFIVLDGTCSVEQLVGRVIKILFK